MNIDRNKLYDTYYTDGDRNKYPVFYEDSDGIGILPPPAGEHVTKHYSRACERADEMQDCTTGKNLGYTFQSYNNKLVTAMVRSGDFDVREAIIVVTDCCERCLNVLEAKYLGTEVECSDYFYDNWDRPCTFCEKEDDKYIKPSRSEEQKVAEEQGSTPDRGSYCILTKKSI